MPNHNELFSGTPKIGHVSRQKPKKVKKISDESKRIDKRYKSPNTIKLIVNNIEFDHSQQL